MLKVLRYKLILPTSLDFALVFAHKLFKQDDAQMLVRNCLPWLYFVALDYDLGRGRKPSAVALAALLFNVMKFDR